MESLQTKIEELHKWRKKEKSFLSILLVVKDYDIRLHTLAINECQEITFKFEERAMKSLVGMIYVYDKLVKDVQIYIQWPKISFRDENKIYSDFFQELKDKYEMTKSKFQEKEVISKDDIQ